MPKRILIAGGGYIAVEFAGIFHGLGAEVTLVYRGDDILRGFDDDVRAICARNGEARHQVRTRQTSRAIEKVDDGRRASVGPRPVKVDRVMFATGREPNTAGLGLKRRREAGAAGAIGVDEYSRTRCRNIYAVGDVTNRVELTPVAIREGQAFADTVFGGQADAGRPHASPDRGLHPAGGRRGRPDRGAGAQRDRQGRGLRDALPPDEGHALRAGGAAADEARRRREAATASSAATSSAPRPAR